MAKCLPVARLLKAGNVARRKLYRIEKCVHDGRSNLTGFGSHRACKLHLVEVNDDAITVITAGNPKALARFLARDWRAEHAQEAEGQGGESRRNESCDGLN